MRGIAGVLVGVAIAIYITVTVLDAIGLNTGLYATTINTVLPLLLFVAGISILLDFLGQK